MNSQSRFLCEDGSLGYWVKVEKGRILNCQIIAAIAAVCGLQYPQADVGDGSVDPFAGLVETLVKFGAFFNSAII
jgi:hypothetical protein